MTGRKQNRTSSSKNSVEGSSEYCSQCRALIAKSAPRLIPKHIKLIWQFLIESYSNSGIFYENAGLCPALRPLLWKYLCKWWCKKEMQRSKWQSVKAHLALFLSHIYYLTSVLLEAGRGVDDKLPRDEEGRGCLIALWELPPAGELHRSWLWFFFVKTAKLWVLSDLLWWYQDLSGNLWNSPFGFTYPFSRCRLQISHFKSTDLSPLQCQVNSGLKWEDPSCH